MNSTEYSYGVARIRANELKLLSATDYEQLIAASDKNAVIRILNDKGWNLPENGTASSTENELINVWSLICECAPDASLLDALIIENDFANLKAVIKTTFSDLPADKYISYPCICPADLLIEAVKKNEFRILPEYLSVCGQAAFNAVSANHSGQAAEILIDKACIETCISIAEKSESVLLKKIMNFRCAKSNIKVALRCALTGKSSDFALEAMSSCSYFDCAKLADNLSGVSDFIRGTELSFLSDSVSIGFTAFEEECDRYISKLLEEAKWEIFGPDPLIAYWFKKLEEVRNARVIISGKENGLAAEEIKKRVRGIDV